MKQKGIGLLYVLLTTFIIFTSIGFVKCDEPIIPPPADQQQVEQPSDSSANNDLNLVSKSEEIMSDATKTFYNFAMAGFPLALIVTLITLFFVHDERKVALVVRTCVVIMVACIVIMLTKAGYVLNTLKDILGLK